MTANGASIQNNGIELTFDYRVMDRKKIKWETKFIYASNQNTVLEMKVMRILQKLWIRIWYLVKEQQTSEVSPGHEYAEFKVLSWVRFGHGLAVDHDLDINTPDVAIDTLADYDWEKNDVYIGKNGYQLCIRKNLVGLCTQSRLDGKFLQ